MKKAFHGPLFLMVLTLSGCGLIPPQNTSSEAEWLPASVSPEAAFSTASITVTAPESTPENAELGLVILDEVTGSPYNSHTVNLEPQGSGTWSIELTLPASTVLRYRYVRLSPSYAEETTAAREAVNFRLAFLPGGTVIQDAIAGWTDQGYQGQTGRITGRVVNAENGNPVTDALIGAAGEHTFTDGMGGFQFDRIIPGLHNLVILAMDGSYKPAQQGAVVAADSLTPAEMSLTPAQKVQVTFELTLPENTPEELPVRLAGNVSQLGQTFYTLEGGTSTSASLMPTMIRIDPTHAIMITDLYEGTDLHYKYTLGDGLWNAERTAEGFFKLRQALVISDLILRDSVDSWYGEQQGSIYFLTSIPEQIRPDSVVTMQFNPFTWFYPLPMVKQDNNQWMFILMNPLDFSNPVDYRYCIDYNCAYPDTPTASLASGNSQIEPQNISQLFEDQVLNWGWENAAPAPPVALPESTSRPSGDRPSFETGLELLPLNHPFWQESILSMSAAAVDMNAQNITFTPAWTVRHATPTPDLRFLPEHSPFYQDLASAIQSASGNGLKINIRPVIICVNDLDLWWQEAPRDWAWWNQWFDRYRSMIITYAHLAQETGSDRLILGGAETTPALPGGLLADGSSSSAPADAENRWRNLIAEVRSIYTGTIAFEVAYTSTTVLPPFLDSVDEVFLNWEPALADSSDTAPEVLQRNADALVSPLDSLVSAYPEMPVFVSFSFPSVDGGSTACIQGQQTACLNPDLFDMGADPTGSPPADFAEQMDAVHALLLALYGNDSIDGVYLNRINPAGFWPDKSASIMGKPAQQLVEAWFMNITR